MKQTLEVAQSSFWQTVATKSLVLRAQEVPQGVPKLIFADSCSEIIGFRGLSGSRPGVKLAELGPQGVLGRVSISLRLYRFEIGDS